MLFVRCNVTMEAVNTVCLTIVYCTCFKLLGRIDRDIQFILSEIMIQCMYTVIRCVAMVTALCLLCPLQDQCLTRSDMWRFTCSLVSLKTWLV